MRAFDAKRIINSLGATNASVMRAPQRLPTPVHSTGYGMPGRMTPLEPNKESV